MKSSKWVPVALAAVLIAGIGIAQRVQAPGASTTTATISGVATVQITQTDGGVPVGVLGVVSTNPSAVTSGQTSEALVLFADAGTFPATPLSGRRAVELQNLGPNAIWCNLGTSSTGVAVGLGRKLGSVGSVDSVWSMDISDAIAIRCIASTAIQVTTAATIVTEIK